MLLAKIKTLLTVLEMPGAIRALATWPIFSMASFLMVSRLKRSGMAPRTVIDLGANIGQFALAASRLFEGVSVYSLEPDPRTASILRRNLTGARGVEVMSVAAGDQEGEAEFFVNKDTQVSSMLKLGKDRIQAFPDSVVVEKIRVPVSTLDAMFARKNLERPILVKIDVQGVEDRVIRGGREFLKEVDWVLMEVSFEELYEGEHDFISLMAMMEENGFHFLRPLNFHVSPLTGQIMEMDALFGRSVKASACVS